MPQAQVLTVMTDLEQRKGASSPAKVPAEVLQALHQGRTQSRSLGEWLAIDRLQLLTYVLDRTELDALLVVARQALCTGSGRLTAVAQSKAIGKAWAQHAELDRMAYLRLATHPADVVRECVACAVGARSVSMEARLQALQCFAADAHFGVREMAWMAIREAIVQEPLRAIAALQAWVMESDANLRRFAIEATRPRGVWASHIGLLKKSPEHGLRLLEPLRADPSKYVRDSVANWINDAAKSRPDFALELARQWGGENADPLTHTLLRRALRSIPGPRGF